MFRFRISRISFDMHLSPGIFLVGRFLVAFFSSSRQQEVDIRRACFEVLRRASIVMKPGGRNDRSFRMSVLSVASAESKNYDDIADRYPPMESMDAYMLEEQCQNDGQETTKNIAKT